MRIILSSLLISAALLLSACPSANQPGDNKTAEVPGGSAKGFAIGSGFDGKPLTIGKGELEGKGVYITYFATW